MQVKSTEEIVRFLTPYAERLGAEILEAKWDLRKNQISLTIFLDAKGGVDLNLLETFHTSIDSPLDELDPTFGSPYTLNCSSAGLDRPFQTERDYQRHLGEKVEVKLYAALEGKKTYEGVLKEYNGKEIIISSEEGDRILPLNKIAKASLLIEI